MFYFGGLSYIKRMELKKWLGTIPLNPYRVFFPVGLLFGIMGVGFWVFWSVGWRIPQVALVHAAFQSQGFLTSFVIGFLMTAFPRFTGTWPATKYEISMMSSGAVSFFLSVLYRHWILAEVSYLLLIVTLISFAARRVPHRNKELPPSFLLMGFGFLHALIGPVLILASNFGTKYFAIFSIGRQMSQLGFLLCMVLGVTGKLAPFLLGYIDDPEQDSEKNPWFRERKNQVLIHGAAGAFLFLSFWVDGLSPKWGAGLRAVVVTLHLLFFARIARPLRKKTTLMFFFHLSCWMLPLGLWLAFLWPHFRIAALHVIFVGGFSLMIFSFGMLIVFSHSAKAALINTRLRPMKFIGVFVLGAVLLRFAAELVSARYLTLIHYSSGLWVVAALVWGVFVIPKMLGVIIPEH